MAEKKNPTLRAEFRSRTTLVQNSRSRWTACCYGIKHQCIQCISTASVLRNLIATGNSIHDRDSWISPDKCLYYPQSSTSIGSSRVYDVPCGVPKLVMNPLKQRSGELSWWKMITIMSSQHTAKHFYLHEDSRILCYGFERRLDKHFSKHPKISKIYRWSSCLVIMTCMFVIYEERGVCCAVLRRFMPADTWLGSMDGGL